MGVGGFWDGSRVGKGLGLIMGGEVGVGVKMNDGKVGKVVIDGFYERG